MDNKVKNDLLALLYEYLILNRINPTQNDYMKQKENEIENYIYTKITESDLRDCFKENEVRNIIEAIDDNFFNSALDEIVTMILKKHLTLMGKKASQDLKEQTDNFDEKRWLKNLSDFKYTEVAYTLPSGKIVTANDYQLGKSYFNNLYGLYLNLYDTYIEAKESEIQTLEVRKNELERYRENKDKADTTKGRVKSVPFIIGGIISFLVAGFLGYEIIHTWLWFKHRQNDNFENTLVALIFLIVPIVLIRLGFFFCNKALYVGYEVHSFPGYEEIELEMTINEKREAVKMLKKRRL